MPTIPEGDLEFGFPEEWSASKYDDWAHYRNQLNGLAGGMKAVDFVAVAPRPESCCWLVEVKDYRRNVRTKPSDLADEVAVKVRDTLAGLASARIRASDDGEREAARRALRTKDLRVVLHLEQPSKSSKLFPRAIDPANVQADLRRKLKSVDPHPLVVETATSGRVPWDVDTVKGARETRSSKTRP